MKCNLISTIGWIFNLLVSMQASYAHNSIKETHLIVTGSNLPTDGAMIYNCLAYQGCETTRFEFGTERRLHIFTTKSEKTVLEQINNCNLTQLIKSRVQAIHVYNQTTNTSKLLEVKEKDKFINLSPAILSQNALNNVASFLKKNDSPKMLDAINQSIKILEIKNASKYNIEIDEEMDSKKDIAAILNHKQGFEEIKFNGILNPSETLRTTRHEFEHVLQHNLLQECGRFKSTFSNHSTRERAAFLNDAYYNISKYDYINSLNTILNKYSK